MADPGEKNGQMVVDDDGDDDDDDDDDDEDDEDDTDTEKTLFERES